MPRRTGNQGALPPDTPATGAFLPLSTHDQGALPLGTRAGDSAPRHPRVKGVGRAKGRSVVAAAYRSGERLTDERTGEVFDYRARGGVAETFILAPDNAPAWARDRAQLWNEAELSAERANGRIANEIVLALPCQLDAATRTQMLKDYLAPLVEKHRLAADVAIHVPGEGKDPRNLHAHVLITHHELDPHGFGDIANRRTIQKKSKVKGFEESQFRARSIAGIAAEPEDVTALRRDWEQVVNRAYERAGMDIRVDHRSHEDRGLDQEPTRHLGPAAAEMEKREPGSSDLARMNRDIAERNAERKNAPALEAEVRELSAEIIDLKAERAMREAREAAKGRYDMTGAPPPAAHDPAPGRYDELRAAEPPPEVVRAFESSASRTAEPAAPVWERDADNAEWEAKLADAAIANAEAQKAGQRPDSSASDKTRAEAGTTADRDNRGTPAELWDELRAWNADAHPARADEIEARQETRDTAATPDHAADEMFDAIEDTLDLGSKVAGGVTGRLAKAVESILGGILEYFGGGTKLSPMQAKLAARANEELAEVREQIAALQEKESAQDWQIFAQDKQRQQEDLERETGYRERPGDREREREREWP